MRWFSNMLEYFGKINGKWMGKIGKDPYVYLMAYNEREIQDDSGLGTFPEWVTTQLLGAIVVPLPVERSRGAFGEMLKRTRQGEYMTGDCMLYIDVSYLNSQGLVIDTRLDRVRWDGDQYKLMKQGKYDHYFGMAVYLMNRVVETGEHR